MANLKSIAAQVFDKNPDVDEVYVTSDGYSFLSSNAANLHKNTNKEKKKIKVVSFKREETADDSADKAKSFSKMKKDELIAFAQSNGIDISEATNNDERVQAIEDALAKTAD